MNRLSLDYYLQKLNRIPSEAKQILHQIRTLDKQVLKMQIQIRQTREKVLMMAADYEERKRGDGRERKTKNQIKDLKSKKKADQKERKMKNNAGRETSFQQEPYDSIKNKKQKSEITETLGKIDELHKQMLKQSKKKIQLADKLYNYIDAPTEQLEIALTKYFNPPSLQNNRRNGIRRKKDQSQQFLSSEPSYCYCNGPSFGQMVQCNNSTCVKQWFHIDCVGKGEDLGVQWYCKDCRKKGMKNKKR